MQLIDMTIFCQNVHQTCLGMLEQYDQCRDKKQQIDNLGLMSMFAGSVYKMCDVYEKTYGTKIEAAAILGLVTVAFGIYTLSECKRLKVNGEHIGMLYQSIIEFIEEFDVPVEGAIQHVLGQRSLSDNVVKLPVRAATCTQKP